MKVQYIQSGNTIMKPLCAMDMDLKMKDKIVNQVMLGDGYLWEGESEWRE
jgi:hypothetical protein